MAIVLSVVLIPLIVVFQRQHPRDLGLEPVGRAAPGDGDRVDNAPDNISDNIVDAEWAAIEWTLTRALRTSRFWRLFGAYFAVSMPGTRCRCIKPSIWWRPDSRPARQLWR